MSSLTSGRDCAIIYKLDRRKYPRGRRGSPAKGVAGLKPGEGSNPSFRATSERISLRSDVFFCEAKKDVIHSVTSVPPFKPEAGGLGFVFLGRVCFVTFVLSSKSEAGCFGFGVGVRKRPVCGPVFFCALLFVGRSRVFIARACRAYTDSGLRPQPRRLPSASCGGCAGFAGPAYRCTPSCSF